MSPNAYKSPHDDRDDHDDHDYYYDGIGFGRSRREQDRQRPSDATTGQRLPELEALGEVRPDDSISCANFRSHLRPAPSPADPEGARRQVKSFAARLRELEAEKRLRDNMAHLTLEQERREQRERREHHEHRERRERDERHHHHHLDEPRRPRRRATVDDEPPCSTRPWWRQILSGGCGDGEQRGRSQRRETMDDEPRRGWSRHRPTVDEDNYERCHGRRRRRQTMDDEPRRRRRRETMDNEPHTQPRPSMFPRTFVRGGPIDGDGDGGDAEPSTGRAHYPRRREPVYGETSSPSYPSRRPPPRNFVSVSYARAGDSQSRRRETRDYMPPPGPRTGPLPAPRPEPFDDAFCRGGRVGRVGHDGRVGPETPRPRILCPEHGAWRHMTPESVPYPHTAPVPDAFVFAGRTGRARGRRPRSPSAGPMPRPPIGADRPIPEPEVEEADSSVPSPRQQPSPLSLPSVPPSGPPSVPPRAPTPPRRAPAPSSRSSTTDESSFEHPSERSFEGGSGPGRLGRPPRAPRGPRAYPPPRFVRVRGVRMTDETYIEPFGPPQASAQRVGQRHAEECFEETSYFY